MATIKVKSTLLIMLFFAMATSFAQVGIGIASPNSSAMLDVDVSGLAANAKKGFLPPRMDETARGLITTPAAGLVIFNTTTNQLNYYNGSAWISSVDLTTNQTIAGNKTFSGTLTPAGRLMLPMGEISYFDNSGIGFEVAIGSKSTGTASGTDNMVKIAPGSGTVFINDMFGTGTNSTLKYTGATRRLFHIALSFSYSPDNDKDVFVFGVLKNDFLLTTSTVTDSSKLLITTGSKADYNSTAMHVLLWLSTNDSIEFYVGNVTAARKVFIKSFNFVAIGM